MNPGNDRMQSGAHGMAGAKWVKARQDRLDALVSATWASEPELHSGATVHA